MSKTKEQIHEDTRIEDKAKLQIVKSLKTKILFSKRRNYLRPAQIKLLLAIYENPTRTYQVPKRLLFALTKLKMNGLIELGEKYKFFNESCPGIVLPLGSWWGVTRKGLAYVEKFLGWHTPYFPDHNNKNRLVKSDQI